MFAFMLQMVPNTTVSTTGHHTEKKSIIQLQPKNHSTSAFQIENCTHGYDNLLNYSQTRFNESHNNYLTMQIQNSKHLEIRLYFLSKVNF